LRRSDSIGLAELQLKAGPGPRMPSICYCVMIQSLG
jgi:hypothetical protein